jgi:hypothetical protein
MSSFRLPQSLLKSLDADGADAALRHEIVEEQAATLGRMARKMEVALIALKDHGGEGRAEVVRRATDAVWCFLVQREVLGLRDRAAIVAQYDIPREVLVRLGIR